MKNGENHLHPWIEPELEADIVALVLGEASDFETEKLDRLIEERPELAIYRHQVEAMDDLLSEVVTGKPRAGGTVKPWRLPENRRKAVLTAIGDRSVETEEAEDVEEMPASAGMSPGSTWRRKIPLRPLLNVAAVLCLLGFLAALLIPASTSMMRSAKRSVVATVDESARREEESRAVASSGYYGLRGDSDIHEATRASADQTILAAVTVPEVNEIPDKLNLANMPDGDRGFGMSMNAFEHKPAAPPSTSAATSLSKLNESMASFPMTPATPSGSADTAASFVSGSGVGTATKSAQPESGGQPNLEMPKPPEEVRFLSLVGDVEAKGDKGRNDVAKYFSRSPTARPADKADLSFPDVQGGNEMHFTRNSEFSRIGHGGANLEDLETSNVTAGAVTVYPSGSIPKKAKGTAAPDQNGDGLASSAPGATPADADPLGLGGLQPIHGGDGRENTENNRPSAKHDLEELSDAIADVAGSPAPPMPKSKPKPKPAPRPAAINVPDTTTVESGATLKGPVAAPAQPPVPGPGGGGLVEVSGKQNLAFTGASNQIVAGDVIVGNVTVDRDGKTGGTITGYNTPDLRDPAPAEGKESGFIFNGVTTAGVSNNPGDRGKEKVPALGDLPVTGRLFRQGEANPQPDQPAAVTNAPAQNAKQLYNDFDNGMGKSIEGPAVNKGDDGNVHSLDFRAAGNKSPGEGEPVDDDGDGGLIRGFVAQDAGGAAGPAPGGAPGTKQDPAAAEEDYRWSAVGHGGRQSKTPSREAAPSTEQPPSPSPGSSSRRRVVLDGRGGLGTTARDEMGTATQPVETAKSEISSDDALAALSELQEQARKEAANPALEKRIEELEMAYRLQSPSTNWYSNSETAEPKPSVPKTRGALFYDTNANAAGENGQLGQQVEQLRKLRIDLVGEVETRENYARDISNLGSIRLTEEQQRENGRVVLSAPNGAVENAGVIRATRANGAGGEILITPDDVAFQDDDEPKMLKPNIRAGGAEWATPMAGGDTDRSLGRFESAQHEWQRYPGKKNLDRIKDLVPRVVGGGSRNGTADIDSELVNESLQSGTSTIGDKSRKASAVTVVDGKEESGETVIWADGTTLFAGDLAANASIFRSDIDARTTGAVTERAGGRAQIQRFGEAGNGAETNDYAHWGTETALARSPATGTVRQFREGFSSSGAAPANPFDVNRDPETVEFEGFINYGSPIRQRDGVEVAREFIYPTEYDPPEIPNSIFWRTVGDPSAETANPFPVTPSVQRVDDYSRLGFQDAKQAFAAQRMAPPAGLEEKNAAEESFSTFSLHVSDVSFKLAQAALAKGEWPEAGKVRIEEFVNAFDYGDPNPSQEDKVACNVEQAIHPFLQQRNLLRVAMRTAAAGRAGDTPLRLTFLLDNSGSMERADREETVRRAFALLAGQLQPIDQVTLISFARQPRLLADKVTGDKSGNLVEVVSNLPSEGGTNLEAALELAFEKAQEQKADGAQNRIVLLTDGAANLGNAKPESLGAMIESMREEGIAFDAAGIGADGLNDEILEALTRKGDGRYYLLDRPEDADDGFARQIAGALRPAAKNVKVQVEFNPGRVGNYKLLGFEKHRLKKEDFRDDSVDAAEMAAEEAGVAVYQFEAKPDGEGDVGFVSVRFRDMSSGEMVEQRWPIPYEPSAPRPDQAAPSMQIAAVAALFAAKLNGEPLGDTVELDELARTVGSLPESFQNKERVQQLRQMIEQARAIASK